MIESYSVSISYVTKNGDYSTCFLISEDNVDKARAIEVLKTKWLDDSNYRWYNDPFFRVESVRIGEKRVRVFVEDGEQ